MAFNQLGAGETEVPQPVHDAAERRLERRVVRDHDDTVPGRQVQGQVEVLPEAGEV